MRVVYVSKRFKVLKGKYDYIVVKHNNNFYTEHGHFQKLYNAREFINIIEKGLLPKNEYYLKCAMRLLNTHELEELKVKI